MYDDEYDDDELDDDAYDAYDDGSEDDFDDTDDQFDDEYEDDFDDEYDEQYEDDFDDEYVDEYEDGFVDDDEFDDDAGSRTQRVVIAVLAVFCLVGGWFVAQSVLGGDSGEPPAVADVGVGSSEVTQDEPSGGASTGSIAEDTATTVDADDETDDPAVETTERAASATTDLEATQATSVGDDTAGDGTAAPGTTVGDGDGDGDGDDESVATEEATSDEAPPATAAASTTAAPRTSVASGGSGTGRSDSEVTYETLPDGSPAPVVAVFGEDEITLTGAVPSRAAKNRLRVLAEANAKPGQADSIDNRVTVNPDVPVGVGVRVIELTSERFPATNARIRPAHARELDRAVGIMEALPNITALVIGHTDQMGDEERNFALSEQRADAVVEYLVSEGISPQRLSSRAVGEADLLTLNDDEVSLALNRRTEFVFYGLLVA